MGDIQIVESLNGNFGTCGRLVEVSCPRLGLTRGQNINLNHLTSAQKELLVSEVTALRELSHENVLNLKDVILNENSSKLLILLEPCDWDTLTNCQNLRSETTFPEKILWTLAWQLVRALHFLHSSRTSSKNQILHGNITPDSIFVSQNSSSFKLGGFSYGIPPFKYYCPCPELSQGQSYTAKTDLWYLGCIIYGLCIRRIPFEGLSSQDISTFTQQKRLGSSLKDYSEDLRTIVSLLLTPTPELRPSALMLQHHPILHNQASNETKPSSADTNRSRYSGIVLETAFPLATEKSSRESLFSDFNDTFSTIANDFMNSTESSINHYLSMLGGNVDETASTASAAAQLSSETINLFSGLRLDDEPKKSNSLETRLMLIEKKELSLTQWAQMLQEKEQELLHKEKRLNLWESCLRDMLNKLQGSESYIPRESFGLGKNPASSISKETLRPVSSSPILEHSFLESDLETTVSADPGDLSILPTAVKLEPSKIKNPFSPHDSNRRISFDPEKVFRKQLSRKPFEEQRASWLANKRQQHQVRLRPSDWDPESLGNMEEKTIGESWKAREKRRSNPPLPEEILGKHRKDKKSIKFGKENLTEKEFWQRSKEAMAKARSGNVYERQIIPEEIREKLKAQNLPGFRC